MAAEDGVFSDNAESKATIEHHRRKLMKDIAQTLLGYVKDEIKSLPRNTKAENREPPSDTTKELKVDAAKKVLGDTLSAFASVVDEDILRELISQSDETPSSTRDSVISWIRAIAPLIALVNNSTYPVVDPDTIIERFRSLKDDVIINAFWAPRPATKSDGRRADAINKLMAIGLDRAFAARGFDQRRVRDAICTYFGASRWDTIRKWEKSAGLVLGSEHTKFVLDSVSKDSVLFTKDNNWAFGEMFIYLYGIIFRREAGIKHLPQFRGQTEVQAWMDAHSIITATETRTPESTSKVCAKSADL